MCFRIGYKLVLIQQQWNHINCKLLYSVFPPKLHKLALLSCGWKSTQLFWSAVSRVEQFAKQLCVFLCVRVCFWENPRKINNTTASIVRTDIAQMEQLFRFWFGQKRCSCLTETRAELKSLNPNEWMNDDWFFGCSSTFVRTQIFIYWRVPLRILCVAFRQKKNKQKKPKLRLFSRCYLTSKWTTRMNYWPLKVTAVR